MTKTKPRPAFGYVRVSTDEQEENRTSIESQIASVERYARDHGYQIIEMFIEPAMSGRNQRRPKFLQMIEQATAPDHPVDAIIGWAQSRLWRDLETHVTTRNSLRKAGVALLSVTQQFGTDSTGEMLGNITAMFDEHFARETAKHTRRTMRANAEEGFYNGGRVPFGYETRTVEVRGKKEKRKLFIHEEEAAVVRLVFDLADRGDGDGPMGGRAIAAWLNERGYTLRGKPFYNGTLAKILAQPHYLGRYPNMTLDEHGKKLPEEEWIWVDCPPIIEPEQAARIATSRAKRSPRVTAPRIVSGPTLLIGKIKCGACGAGFVLATGKGGRYRYYRCDKRTNCGASSCRCPAVRVEKLDGLVIEALDRQLFAPDRLRELLAKIIDVSDQARNRQRDELTQCKTEQERSQTALSRLLDLVAQGLMSPRDPALAGKIAEHRTRIATLSERAALLERQLVRAATVLTDDLVERLSRLIRDKLRDDKLPQRRNYVRMFVGEVIVAPGGGHDGGSAVTIRGSKSTLETAAISTAVSKTDHVPIFDREWCGREDSNFHGLSPTTTSTLRVYQFRHDRTSGWKTALGPRVGGGL